MKPRILFGTILVTALGFAASPVLADDQAGGTPSSPVAGQTTALPDSCSKRAPSFGIGEELQFNVMYGPVKAGTATLSIPEIVDVQGRKAFHVMSRARSSHGFSMVFEVNDKVDSWWDVACLRSLAFEKHLREGDYRKDEEIKFDYDAKIARYKSGTEVAIAGDAQDMLSSIFLVRSFDLQVGKSVFMEAHSDGKNYTLEVKVLREEQTTTSAGTFDCYVVEPFLKGSGIFRHKGSLQIWMTRDSSHMPVLMKTKIPVGSIVAELTSFRPGAAVDAGTGGMGATLGAVDQADVRGILSRRE